MLFSSWLRNWKATIERRMELRRTLEGRRLRSSSPPRRGTRKFTVLCLEELETRLTPAVLTVSTTADVINPSDGTLSLRDAIAAVDAGNANGLTGAEQSQVSGTFGVNDTIQFDNSLSGQTITLKGSALPSITQNVKIMGLGAGNLAISGNSQSGIFMIDAGTQVSLSDLTIEDGSTTGNGGAVSNSGTATVSNCILSDNSAGNGGGIYSGGTLTVSNCTLSDNTAGGGGGGIACGGSVTVSNCALSGNSAGGTGGGGIFCGGAATVTVSDSNLSDNSGDGFGGGGILSFGTLTVSNCTLSGNSTSSNGGGITNVGTLTLSNCTLSDNAATSYGGGVYNGGTMMLSNSTLSDNSTSVGGYGGGIMNWSGQTLTVSSSTLSDNSAAIGAGVCNFGTLTLSTSALSGNSATNAGAGIANYSTATVSDCTLSDNSVNNLGGGAYNNGTLSLRNSTLSGNSAGAGGGILNDNSATLTLNNCTLANNVNGGIQSLASASATLNNTIVARNTGGDLQLFGGTFSGAHDLIGDGSYLSSFSNSLQGNPLLAPLGDYGGPTQTMALLPGSIAIDAGGNALIPADITTDQRGQPRIAGSAVDIGAFESQGFTITVTSGNNQGTRINTAFANSLVVTVTAKDGIDPVVGGQITFTAPSSGASAALSPASPVTISANGTASVTAVANGTGGSYKVVANAAGAVSSAAFSLINQVAPKLSVSDASGTYNGHPFTAVGTALGLNNQPVTGSFSYAYYVGSSASGTPSGTAPTNAGTYTVVATFTSNDPGYTSGGTAQTTFTISPKALASTASTQSALNIAKSGTFNFQINVNTAGIVDGQSIAQLFNGMLFSLNVGGKTYSVQAVATVTDGVISISFQMTDQLKAFLAAFTSATNASNAPTVAIGLHAVSKDGNYALDATASTKLFNSTK